MSHAGCGGQQLAQCAQNVSWANFEGQGDGYGYPRARHILSVFPLAAGVFSVRLLFER